MDNKQVIAWIGAAVARGIAWVLAAKCGLDAAQADSEAAVIANALVALALAGVSIYSSVKGRRKLAGAVGEGR